MANPNKLTVKVIKDDGAEADFEVFMSFGLLQNLCSLVGSVENLGALNLDPEVSATAVAMCLVPRKPNGIPSVDMEKFQTEAPGLSPEAAAELLDWVTDRVTDFFMKRVEKTLTSLERNQVVSEKIKSIASSLNGTQASASMS